MFAAVAVLGLAIANGLADPAGELPRGWVFRDIEQAAPPYDVAGVCRVLAWAVEEDDRPLRVERCLVLKEWIGSGGRTRATLSHLYRHPRGQDKDWQLPPVWVSPPPPLGPVPTVAISQVKRFESKLTSAIVSASLADVRWSFVTDPDWRLLSCAVCERNWERATGSRPAHSFRAR